MPMRGGASGTDGAGRPGGGAGRQPAGAVFTAFFLLGLTSFGGPVAHIGYFREAFVARRRWLDDRAYADLVALCQMLPGPTSSQVGIGIGLAKAGLPGAAAAWAGFTLPSAVIMLAFGYGVATYEEAIPPGALQGLKTVAAAVVAQAVWAMARMLCPDAPRATIGGAGCGGRRSGALGRDPCRDHRRRRARRPPLHAPRRRHPARVARHRRGPAARGPAAGSLPRAARRPAAARQLPGRRRR